MPNIHLSPRAEALKLEANRLFQNQDWSMAFITYSAAISVEPRSAVLYGNRSATSMKMNRYHQALSDAKKAIELDHGWDKAHARAAAAHEALNELTSAHLKYLEAAKFATKPASKDEYERLARLVIEKAQRASEATVAQSYVQLKNPTDKFMQMVEQGHIFPLDSAVVRNVNTVDSVLKAWKDILGLAITKTDANGKPLPQAQHTAKVKVGAVSDFVSCVLQDPMNSFAVTSSTEWNNPVDLIQHQIQWEAVSNLKTSVGVFSNLGDLFPCLSVAQHFQFENTQNFIQYFESIVSAHGWDHVHGGPQRRVYSVRRIVRLLDPNYSCFRVRDSLSLAIRIPILAGMVYELIAGHYGTAAQKYEQSLAYIDAIRARWPDLGPEIVGTSIKETFRRAVQARYLMCLEQRASARPKPLSSEFEEIKKVANELLESCRAHPVHLGPGASPSDIIHWVAFDKSIRAEAHMALAYAYRNTRDDPEDGVKCLQNYLLAAAWFPLDDYRCAMNLWYALNISMREGGISLEDIDAMIAKAQAAEKASQLFFDKREDPQWDELKKWASKMRKANPRNVFLGPVIGQADRIVSGRIHGLDLSQLRGNGSGRIGIFAEVHVVETYKAAKEEAKQESEGVLVLSVD
ncbi:uncharacterized protein EI90DRAFT_3116119 [Cantharellus anzutake]|uniref:uncharacterized protein n=1 Tax=Cantharellus anzutake TaxID=1750568 RepID=UPI0019056CF1|nr:uncharacterized protein EI90DRAFT_3116119 [Cantharellus anzutake]KAF8342180.1 hypothetical protein EI90DRAFT_3116119 [Cantharellus anzutake]